MSKLQNMRIVEIPKFRAVSSGEKRLDEIFDENSGFAVWVEEHHGLIVEHIFEPFDYLWHENCDINRSVLIYPIIDWVTEKDTEPYPIVAFPGGLFLVATADEWDDADLNETVSGMYA